MLAVLIILVAWAMLLSGILLLLRCSARADDRTGNQLDREYDYAGPIPIDGYGALLLKRLTVQTCRMIGVDSAAIFLENPQRSELTLVAGHRIDDDMIGRRAPSAERVGDVIASGARVWAQPADLMPIARLLPRGPGALIAGIESRGARGLLVAGGGGPFSERDLALVGHVADLAGAALGDAGMRSGLDVALESGVRALEAAIDRADLRAARTGRELVRLATMLARPLGLDAPALVELQLAARLREVGDLTGAAVLDDMGLDLPPPKPAEIAVRSADILAGVPGLEVVALIVRHEHERWDGRGAPERVAGDRIPLASRILAVAATFADLTGPGRSSDADAVTVMAVAAGSRFDPIVVETLAAIALPPSVRPVASATSDWAAADLELVA